MIKKLRIKLVTASMFSLFVVILVIMCTIAVLNYKKIADDADSTLSILIKNNGVFPKTEPYSTARPGSEEPHRGRHLSSPELPYESRYFSVTLDEKGNVISSDTGKIAAVDSDTAIEYAQSVYESGKSGGFLGYYRYAVHTSGTETRFIFLDCRRSLDTFYAFVRTGISISLTGLFSVLVLLIFLSGRIVKPFIENYEKQKRFITDAGHELKTPLTIINADAEILEMDTGDNEWIRDIKSQTQRLADLTESLILLSRMEEKHTPDHMIEFPLSDLAEETLASFQALAKTRNKEITGKIQPMLSMRGDEKAIRRLISILLDNAVKYSEKDGRISLTLEKQKNSVCLTVFNTTPCISRENLEHLFDRFYRTDKSRNSQTGGYGLGLSIAAAIVNAHRGRYSASTEDEHSLKITIYLPV